MKKTLFLIFAALMGFIGVSAQDVYVPSRTETITLTGDGSAEDEATFTYEANDLGVHGYKFTAPVDGTIEFHVGWTSVMIYLTDSEWTEDTKQMLSKQIDGDGNFYFTDVVAGETYYFSTSLMSDPVTIKVKYGAGDPGITISSNMTDGQTYSLGGTNLELTIDRQVNAGYYVAYTGADGQPVEEVIGSEYYNPNFASQFYVQFNLYSLIEYLMDGGKIDFGDTFTIRMKNITSVADPTLIYGEDGVYEVTLVLGERPASVTSIVPADGSELYSYYTEDSDDGLITFTFSDPLDESLPADVTVSYGDMEAGSYVSRTLDYTIEGNTLTADLRGIKFPETVEGGRGSSTATQTQITIAVSGLKTTDGRDVQTNYPNRGTSAVMAIYRIVKEDIVPASFFLPDPIKTLVFREDKEITFYIDVPINYDGVDLTYWDASGRERTKHLEVEDVPFTEDNTTGQLYYKMVIPLAGTTFYNQGIVVTITNATLMNGDPVKLTATYKGTMEATGISGVVVDEDADKVVKVYSIDGTFVKEGAAGTVLNGLPKGLYITNGKKVMVK